MRERFDPWVCLAIAKSKSFTIPGQISNDPKKVGTEKWEATLEGVVKFNWDVAIDKQKKTIGLGIVERNSKGQFVATLNK